MNYYDTVAKEWDTPLRLERAKIISDKIFETLALLENASALEFGCGTGLISLYLVDKFDHISLMDSSVGMINQLKQKIANTSIKNMTPILYDMECSCFSKKYDVIYSSMALHHIKNVPKMISNFYNMLNPSGKLCIVDLDKDNGGFHSDKDCFEGHNGFLKEDFIQMFSNARFSDNNIETFYYDNKMINKQPIPYSLFCASGTKQ